MRLRALLAAGMLAIAGTAGAQTFRIIPQEVLDSLAHPATAAGSEAMRFERTTLDLGSLNEEDAPATGIFRWHNAGDRPLVVTRVQTGCGCAAADYDRRPVLAGGTGEIRITYRPKGHPGRLQRRIFVYTQLSERQPTAILELTGDVTPSVRPTHDYPYACGALLLKQRQVRMTGDRRQEERIVCLNAGDVPLRITADERLLPRWIGFACEPAELGAGQTGDLVLRFDPALAPERLPEQLPVVLEGVEGRPGERTIRIRFGDAADE